MFTTVWKMLQRECLLCFRNRVELLNPLLFFIVVATLFPLATTPNTHYLQLIGPGVIWVAALLATLLSLPKLFRDDYQDGSLEQLILSPQPLSLLVFVKVMAHWLLFSVPLIVIAPLLAMMFHIQPAGIGVLMITLLLGTPVLSLMGAIIAALTVGLRNGGLMLALILLPLYVPVLIFATAAVIAADSHLAITGQLAILGALLAMTVTLAPAAIAFSLRLGVAYD